MHAAALQPHEMPSDIRWMQAVTQLLGWVMVALAVAAALTWVSRQPFFQIRQVRIEGELQRNNLPTVRANALPRIHGDYFSVDLIRARQVFETVPWVRKAVVRRVWPNELRVTLEEHRPAAYWSHDERDDQLVNIQGEVFDVNIGDVEDEHLPTLKAPTHATADQAQQMLQMLGRLRTVLAPLGSEIDTLELNDRGNWIVTLDDDAVIYLGRGEIPDVIERASRFVRTLPQLQAQYGQPLASADLRYPKGYAVKLRGLTTLQENSVVKSGAIQRQSP